MKGYEFLTNYDEITPPEDGVIFLNKNGVVVMNISTLLEYGTEASDTVKEAYCKLLDKSLLSEEVDNG